MSLNEVNFIEKIGESEFADRLLCLALDIGSGMLKSGGEIHRVEDTVNRICRAYGAEHVEVFAISSVIFAAIRLKGGEYSSQIRRVDSVENHLQRLEQYNSLSREVCKKQVPLNELNERIFKIKKAPSYPSWLRILAAGVGAGVFALFFGGGLWDGLLAMIIGAIMFSVDLLPSARVNRLAKTAVQSFLGGMLASLAIRVGLGLNQDAIMIGTIMVLIPGLSFGTAFRDLLCGDFLTGTLNTVQCVLAAAMIAGGYLLAMFLVGGIV